MIISIIYLVISLVLEVVMSNFFYSTLSDVSLFTTIYTVVGLVIIYPYFNNDKKYFLLVMICGVLFNILYTGSFVYTFLMFIIIGVIIKLLYNVFPENVFMTNLISILVITAYHVFSLVILNVMSTTNYAFILLINIVLGSILMTII